MFLQLYGLSLPHHWLKDFFLAAASLKLVLLDDALSYYTNLSLVGFGSSSYITAQLALTQYHKKGRECVSSFGFFRFEGCRVCECLWVVW